MASLIHLSHRIAEGPRQDRITERKKFLRDARSPRTPTRDGDKRGYDGGGEGAVQKRMRWMEQEGGDEERRSSSQSSHEGSSQG